VPRTPLLAPVAGWGAWLAAGLVLAGCEGAPAPPPRATATAAPPAAGSAPEAGAGAPAPSALVELRARRLDLEPTRHGAQRLAFSRRHLGVLTGDELVLIETEGWSVARRLAVRGPRRVVAAVDGALIAIAQDATLRVQPRDGSLERHGRITLFPGSELWSDRREPLVLWVHHEGDAALYRYRLAPDDGGSLLAPEARFELPGHDGRAATWLPDGAFAYTGGARLHRLYPGGRARSFPLPAATAPPWRLLPSRRLDELWAATSARDLERLRLGPPLVGVARITLPSEPFAVAASEGFVAAVHAERQADGPRAWSLVVCSAGGDRCFAAPLPPEPVPAADDWVERATRDREVALAWVDPWVAVGGPSGVAVWRASSGQPLLTASRGAALLARPASAARR